MPAKDAIRSALSLKKCPAFSTPVGSATSPLGQDRAMVKPSPGLRAWVVENLGPDVPMHFSAFHPDWKMTDLPDTPIETLRRARQIALKNGVRYAYTGNVHDPEGDSTYCHNCGDLLIARDWYEINTWAVSFEGNYTGNCRNCGTPLAGVFDGPPGDWGRKRMPVKINAAPK